MPTHLPKAMLVTLAIIGSSMAWKATAEEPGVGTVVPQGDMTMFCQKAAAARFDAQLDDITTDPPIRRDGRLLVLGTVDSDDSDTDTGFDCRFEENGEYIGIIGAPGND